jgi:hypothetical protein
MAYGRQKKSTSTEITAEVFQEFGVIPSGGKWPVKVTLCSFGDGEPLLDVRAWNPNPGEEGASPMIMGKAQGRFTQEQAVAFYDILTPIVKGIKEQGKTPAGKPPAAGTVKA